MLIWEMGNELDSLCLCFAISLCASYSSSALAVKWDIRLTIGKVEMSTFISQGYLKA